MNDRLSQIYNIASSLFITKGYARTQIKDIADGIGMSAGTMYHYFVGKTDILAFILKGTIEPVFLEQDFVLPVKSALFKDLEREVVATFKACDDAFSRPYRHDDASYTYEQMLSDAFDTVWNYGKGLLLIEKNPDAVPELASAYQNYRKAFFSQMLHYVVLFQKNGNCRKLEWPEYATQLMIETIAWWGMHVMNDAFSLQKDIGKETAKQVCIDALLHAYMA